MYGAKSKWQQHGKQVTYNSMAAVLGYWRLQLDWRPDGSILGTHFVVGLPAVDNLRLETWTAAQQGVNIGEHTLKCQTAPQALHSMHRVS
ncbi:hypothetical protein HaLaN_12569 [Haematococcus lacustris]|uniref:Uncharacterized protein n=1 Tax=Haematococcus lacustris TaxID=44745 RepID=A0A699ZBE1_HAELA|nr:hypothetical protein HaLaN_12569 [Haematococcus lacustris]